jgi:hypothetical protein
VIPSAQRPHVWCGPWSSELATPALQVGLRPRSKGFFWSLSAVRRDLLRGQAFSFPHSFVFDHPSDALLFVLDGTNEAATATGESRGRLFFTRISCRPGAIVSFRIDATVGSELSDGEPVAVSGRFRGRVGSQPWPIP